MKNLPLLLFGLLLAAMFVGFAVYNGSSAESPYSWLIASGLAVGMAFALKDAKLKVTKALPNGAASITTDGIDLGHGTRGRFLANGELLISAPALTTAELPDGQTITYSVEHDTASGFGTVATLYAEVLKQTGAGGAGAAAAEVRVRPPSNVKRHVRVKATKAGAANASTKSVTVEVVL